MPQLRETCEQFKRQREILQNYFVGGYARGVDQGSPEIVNSPSSISL